MLLMNPVTNIKPVCKNLGGIIRIQLIEHSKVLSFPEDVNGVISGVIKLKTGEEFKSWQPDLLSIYSENRKENSTQGDYYEQELLVSASKDRALLTYHHKIMRNDVYAILFTNRNGLTKFLPKMRDLSKMQTGETKGANIYNFRFFYQSQLPAMIFEGTIDNS